MIVQLLQLPLPAFFESFCMGEARLASLHCRSMPGSCRAPHSGTRPIAAVLGARPLAVVSPDDAPARRAQPWA